MTQRARRARPGGTRSTWTRRRVHAFARAPLLLMFAITMSACGDGARPADSRRRDAAAADPRRVGEPAVGDTTSLVTPVREDSLIGVARGAGGEATLRTTCATCHEGAHAAELGRDATASLTCHACHETSHQVTRAFYAGALPAHALAPDTMFLARVSCVGCHVDSTFATPPGPARAASLDAMCASCHGSRFRGMLATWRGGLAWRTQAVSAYVAQASGDARLASAAPRARVRSARQALELLRTAGAVHNVRGADRLFRAALDSTVTAYARAGLDAPPRPALGPDPTRNACLGCHYGVEASQATVFGERFDHASHIVRADIACRDCHSDATYFKDRGTGAASADKVLDPRHGRTTLTATSCESCHHSPTSRVPCSSCHANDARLTTPVRVVMALALKPPQAPTSRRVAFEHAQHQQAECSACHQSPGAVREVASCASCHADHHKERAASCATCHGSTMLATHTMDTHFKCASCHVRETVARLVPERAFCLSCHVKQVTHEPGRECAPCHLHLTPTEVRRRILADTSRAAPTR